MDKRNEKAKKNPACAPHMKSCGAQAGYGRIRLIHQPMTT